MNRQALIAAALLLAGVAHAQDAADTTDGNSFSDIYADDGNSFSDTENTNSFSEINADDANNFSQVTAGSDDAGTESGQGDAEAGGFRVPPLYVSLDSAWTRVSLSRGSFKDAFGGDEFDSSLYRLRLGARVAKMIGLEVHYGIDGPGNSGAGDVSTDQYYGVYLVPTGVLFDLVEIAAPVGYAHSRIERGTAAIDMGGASFGINAELPVLTRGDFALRLTSGGEVYRASNSARMWGYHAGLRVDFKL